MTEPTWGTTDPPPPGPVPTTEPPPPPKTDVPPAPVSNGEEEASLARTTRDDAPPAGAERDPISSVDFALLPNTLTAPVMATPPPAAVAAPVAVPAAEALSPLEQRIRRLEDALAHLQEHRGAETRVAASPAGSPAPAASTAGLMDMGKRLLGVAADAVTSPPIPPSATPAPTLRGRSLWLLWETWAEARAIVRMFVDPRYRLPWSARVLPLVLLGAIVTSYYWVPGTTIPLLGSWINKAVDLVLAFLLFKWLGQEARRYRQTSPDLPPTLRL